MTSTTATKRGILLNRSMVKSTIAEIKTQTRRALASKYIINDEPDRYKYHGMGGDDMKMENGKFHKFGALFEDLRPEITPWINPIPCPYGEVGDLLYVRENYYQYGWWLADTLTKTRTGKPKKKFVPIGEQIRYAEDAPDEVLTGQTAAEGWYQRLGRFMPRKHSRLTLEITSVKMERLQDISTQDAIAEGITNFLGGWLNYTNHTKTFTLPFYEVAGKMMPAAVLSYATLWESINGPDSCEKNQWVWVVEFRIHK